MSTENTTKIHEHVEHIKKCMYLPLERIPNFYLKRPLNQQEMELLRLIALCENDNKESQDNWIRSMVVFGHIPNLLREAEEAKKRGYWQPRVTSNKIPFPPHVKEH